MKKEVNEWGYNLFKPTFKTLLTMKLIFLLVCGLGLLTSVAEKSYAQSTKLTFSLKDASIKNVLEHIENSSEFSFMYENNVVDVNSKVDIEANDETIDVILDRMLDKSIDYRVVGRHIVLFASTQRLGESRHVQSQQQRSVSGKVTDSSGIPLPGVTVVVKGTTQGTVTNADGNYSLSGIPEDATLVFSFVGMRTQEVIVGNQTNINVTMEVDAIGIEEVVAIGYGTMRKSDLTGSVVRADIESFQNQPNANILQSLQGTTPGLNIGAVTRPGDNPSLSIRGRNSLSGSSAPLIVLDGVIYRGNLMELNQNDIESIDILKDASSKAIYGSQAANGVMIITSKKGKSVQTPVFNFSSYYAMQTPSNVLTPLSRDEFIQKTHDYYYEQAYLAPDYTDPNPNFNVTDYFPHQETLDGYNKGTVTDWLDLSTQNGSIFNTDISMAGSSNKLSYYLSAGYTNQEGYAINDKYNKINIRANFEHVLTNWLTVGMQTFVTSADYSGRETNFGNSYLLHQMVEPYNEDGTINVDPLSTIQNPLIASLADDYDKRLNLFGNFSANVDMPFVTGLSYKLNYSNNYRTRRNFWFDTYANNETGRGEKYNFMTLDQTLDNLINYKRTLNEKHAVDITLLYGYEGREAEDTNAQASNFSNDALGYNMLEAGDVETRVTESGAWEEYSLYQMGRLNYRYNNKYLATFTMRRDGFSGFGTNNKFGLFPSVALAWVLSEEKFAQETVPWLNNLKLRLSYGSSGNRTVGRYATLARVSSGYQYVFGSQSAYAQWISSMSNDQLGWETTTGINLGLDFSVLNNRISGIVDYYDEKTTDILYNVNIPDITGFSNIATNIGEIANKGIELSLTTVNIRKSDFIWETRFVISQNKNKIVSILGRDDDGDGVEDDLVSSGLFIGEPLGTIYNFNVIGIYQIGDDIPDGYKPGQYIIEDLNDDGLITQEHDRKILGTNNPAYRFGLQNNITYKNWKLNFFINSIQGGKNDYLGGGNPAGGWWGPNNVDAVNTVKEFDYWTPNNPDAKYANLRYTSPRNPPIYDSRSFIRLQDLNLTYVFPQKMMNDVFTDASIFFSAKNLITITNWIGTDPESGALLTRGAHPVMKSYSLGFNLKF